MNQEFYNDLYNKYKKNNNTHSNDKIITKVSKYSDNSKQKSYQDPMSMLISSRKSSVISSNSNLSPIGKKRKSVFVERKRLSSFQAPTVNFETMKVKAYNFNSENSELANINTKDLQIINEAEFSIIDQPLLLLKANNSKPNNITIIEAFDEEDCISSRKNILKPSYLTPLKISNNQLIPKSKNRTQLDSKSNKINILDKNITFKIKNNTDIRREEISVESVKSEKNNKLKLKKEKSLITSNIKYNDTKTPIKKKKSKLSCFFCF